MGRYIVDVRHIDRYEFTNVNADEAIKIAKDCVRDNYGHAYLDNATFDAIRIDVPTVGDLSDAGMDGA